MCLHSSHWSSKLVFGALGTSPLIKDSAGDYTGRGKTANQDNLSDGNVNPETPQRRWQQWLQ